MLVQQTAQIDTILNALYVEYNRLISLPKNISGNLGGNNQSTTEKEIQIVVDQIRYWEQVKISSMSFSDRCVSITM